MKKRNGLLNSIKKNAADYKKQMEQLQYKNVNQKVSALNMNAEEFEVFMKLLNSGKKSIFEAVNLVIGEKAEEVKEDANGKEAAPD